MKRNELGPYSTKGRDEKGYGIVWESEEMISF
jgi:hypothetical protein